MPSDFSDLERELDRALQKLPAPGAPRTLAPRVMRAVRAQPRTELGGWFTWPLLWQATSLAGMLLVFAGALNVLPIAGWMVGLLASASAVTWPGSLLQQAADIVGAAGVVWRVIEPAAIVLLVFLATMLAASAAFGAALRSVVLGGTSRP